MALVVPNVGEVAMLNAMIGVAGKATPPFTMKLFSNNVTPTGASVAGDFTEVPGGGYASISLAAGTWVVAGNAPSTMTYPLQAFAFTGATGAPGTVYGYIIVDANGVLLVAEQLPTVPFTPSSSNGIIIQPLITMASVNGD